MVAKVAGVERLAMVVPAPDGQPVPGIAPAAKQMGAYVGQVIAARVAGTRQPERPNRLRGELAALAVLFLSARYRVSRTDDAIEAVRKAYLSGRIHQEIEEQTDDDANPVRGPELSPDPGVPQGV